jgi:hypothetical protein
MAFTDAFQIIHLGFESTKSIGSISTSLEEYALIRGLTMRMLAMTSLTSTA